MPSHILPEWTRPRTRGDITPCVLPTPAAVFGAFSASCQIRRASCTLFSGGAGIYDDDGIPSWTNSMTAPSGPSQKAILTGVGGIEGDRKSTRLNSNHLGISYAVFCL